MGLNRREFLCAAGLSIAAGAVFPALSGCRGVTRDDLAVMTERATPFLSPEEREILRLASLAPSSHNTQPWIVTVKGKGRWVISSDRLRWLPQADPGNRELLLSLGAFIENLIIAAGVFGYRIKLTVLAASPFDRDVAEVRLIRDKVRPFPLEKIRTRMTVRCLYERRELKSADITVILKKWPDRIFYFSNSSPEGRCLREGTIYGNHTQAFRDQAQRELAGWIRWSDEEAVRLRDGLTPEGMDIGGVEGWIVRNLYTRAAVMKRSFRCRTVERVAGQVRSAGGWFVIASGDQRVSSLIDTGRRFENLFLGARERSIALHPMSQILEEEPWNRGVASALGITENIQFVLRAGYISSYPKPVSLRRPPYCFVVAGNHQRS